MPKKLTVDKSGSIRLASPPPPPVPAARERMREAAGPARTAATVFVLALQKCLGAFLDGSGELLHLRGTEVRADDLARKKECHKERKHAHKPERNTPNTLQSQVLPDSRFEAVSRTTPGNATSFNTGEKPPEGYHPHRPLSSDCSHTNRSAARRGDCKEENGEVMVSKSTFRFARPSSLPRRLPEMAAACWLRPLWARLSPAPTKVVKNCPLVCNSLHFPQNYTS